MVVQLGASPSAEVVVDLVARTLRAGRPVVGVRPVTDTVKQLDDDGFVAATVDREQLHDPVGPIVMPDDHATTLACGDDELRDDPSAVLARVLAGDHELVEVPPAGPVAG